MDQSIGVLCKGMPRIGEVPWSPKLEQIRGFLEKAFHRCGSDHRPTTSIRCPPIKQSTKSSSEWHIVTQIRPQDRIYLIKSVMNGCLGVNERPG
jgi:hypothetical protein